MLQGVIVLNFSLILPSRERPQLLRNFLESVRETADDLRNLEVLVAHDADDPGFYQLDPSAKFDQEMHNAYKGVMDFIVEHKFNITFQVYERQDGTTPYFNKLAKMAEGRFIWVLNDDCLLTTKHWDTLAMDFLWTVGPGAAFGNDRGFYGHTYDTLGAKDIATDKPTFSMFPLLSRRAYEAAGYVLPPQFPAWGADQHLWSIWERLGRVVDLPMMTVHHVSSHHADDDHPHGMRVRDQVNERVGRLSKHPYPSQEATEADINREAERIRRVLDAVHSLPEGAGARPA
jgi:hypothetical protein